MKTKHIQYQTQGTCSKVIDVTADENNIIQQVFFVGGCNGNRKIRGIQCGNRPTSCPDQLSKALEALKATPAVEE